MSTAMIAMTTSSSISVKPIGRLPKNHMLILIDGLLLNERHSETER